MKLVRRRVRTKAILKVQLEKGARSKEAERMQLEQVLGRSAESEAESEEYQRGLEAVEEAGSREASENEAPRYSDSD